MKEDLENEIEVINSIYGDETLQVADLPGVYVLKLPDQVASLRIQFSEDYPDAPPSVLGTQSSGEQKKGEAGHILDLFRDAVGRLFQPGEVCLYDVIEDVVSNLGSITQEEDPEDVGLQTAMIHEPSSYKVETLPTPPWILSDVVIEMKSVFVARCAPVSSPDQAKQYLQHLLENDKKVAKATHNITAHRIRGSNGATYQDCDDDGETAAGGRVLHLMQLMDLWDVMVVVTRWYGGQKLGPARFGIINGVARDAFVKAGLVADQESGPGKKKGKR